MNAFIYCADIYCADCGAAIRQTLDREGKRPANPDDESSYDSSDYPKGPFADGGGEADCPQHCGACSVFLENPLTPDGLDYVRTAVNNALARRLSNAARHVWAPHYLGEHYGHPQLTA
jgi:hypothetical protein